MTASTDMMAQILGELGEPPVVAVSADLVAAATEFAAAPAPAPAPDYVARLIGVYEAQVKDEREARKEAEARALTHMAEAKSFNGWFVAGVLAVVLLFVMSKQK